MINHSSYGLQVLSNVFEWSYRTSNGLIRGWPDQAAEAAPMQLRKEEQRGILAKALYNHLLLQVKPVFQKKNNGAVKKEPSNSPQIDKTANTKKRGCPGLGQPLFLNQESIALRTYSAQSP